MPPGSVKEEFQEIFSSELMSISGGLLAGTLLAIYVDRILSIPGVFVLMPGFLAMRGNISGSLSARLNSALHLGVLRPKLSRSQLLSENVAAVVSLSAIISLVLGVVAYLVTLFVFGIGHPSIILVSFFAGLLSNAIEIPITVVSTFQLFARGYNPENIMGPFITTVGDIVSIASLLLALWVFG